MLKEIEDAQHFFLSIFGEFAHLRVGSRATGSDGQMANFPTLAI